jgi:hypothetical protein
MIPPKALKNEICDGIDVKKEIKDIFVYHFREKIQK